MAQMALERHAAVSGERQRSTVVKWLTSTDHKSIGMLYLVGAALFFFVGGTAALIFRLELAWPGMQFISNTEFNQLFSMHGTIMIFLAIIPAITGGLGNFAIPLMIGTDDMALPRLNLFSWYLFAGAGVIMMISFVVGAGDVGWTSYPPISVLTKQPGETLWALGVFVAGFSSIVSGLNFVVTVITKRAPGMTWSRLPLFVWASVVTSTLQILATPALAGAMVMLFFDRTLGTVFFEPAAGGDALVWQHVFWFYSHPAVYIMMLPVMGVVSDVLPTFARKPAYGYKFIAYSSVAIGGLGFTVWAHHMFTSGMSPWLRFPFSVTSLIVAVPSGVKVFNWLGTIWRGKLRLQTPMLFALGFVGLFTLGGLSGLIVASVPLDIYLTDTYFIVAHIHYVLFGGTMFGLFAAVYYWYPKMTGRMYNERLGKLHFWLTMITFNVTFFPMHFLGFEGMPRRVSDYAAAFGPTNLTISIAAFALGFAQLILVYNVIHSAYRGKPAGNNPWEGKSLEWQCPSPPPHGNFRVQPVVVNSPYCYGEDAVHAVFPNPGQSAAGQPVRAH